MVRVSKGYEDATREAIQRANRFLYELAQHARSVEEVEAERREEEQALARQREASRR